ncbi:MAG: hypothetical protein ACYTHN_16125 [Planctomycetota bacterium]
MMTKSEAESRVRALLCESREAEVAIESLLEGEMGVDKGFLALLPDRAVFVRNRFGKIEVHGEFPYAGTANPRAEKGILGWEFIAQREGKPIRITHLSEEDASLLKERFTAAPPPSPRDPDPAGSPADATSRTEPPSLSSPEKTPRALPPETPPPPPLSRPDLIRTLSSEPELTPAGTELHKQISEMEETPPIPAEAADILLEFHQALDSGTAGRDLRENRFGMKILLPVIGVLENPEEPADFRVLASQALASFKAKRLLSFLVYHASREKEPEVARALFTGLARIGGQAAVHCLLKIISRGRMPFARIALAVVENTPWVPVVPFLARRNPSVEEPFYERLAAACAWILRLPPDSGERYAFCQANRAAEFVAFWKGKETFGPLALIKASIEKNLKVLQTRDKKLREIADVFLDTLTAGFDADIISSGDPDETDPVAWLVWWSKNKDRPPSQWLNPEYEKALSLPVPGLKDPKRRPGEKESKPGKKGGMGLRETAARAIGAGALSGFLLWLVLVYISESWHREPFITYLVTWGLTGAAGGFALFRPQWGGKTIPWGIAGGFVHYLLTLPANVLIGTAGQAVAWALICTGFFKARKSDHPAVLTALLGGGIFIGYQFTLGPVIRDTIQMGFVVHGIFASLFWFILFLPETGKD